MTRSGNRFRPGEDGSVWYYRELAAFFKREFKGTPKKELADELGEAAEALAAFSHGT